MLTCIASTYARFNTRLHIGPPTMDRATVRNMKFLCLRPVLGLGYFIIWRVGPRYSEEASHTSHIDLGAVAYKSDGA